MANVSSLKSKTLTNLIWRFFERAGAQLVGFIVSIILARLLSPEHYGTIALVTVITSILNVFVDSGLGNALIQKKDAGDLDFSTVFIANILFCFLLYTLLFFSAPFIAFFYKDEQLTPVIRVLGLTLIFSGLKNIQQAYVSKNLLFKKFFFATLTGTIVAAILGIFFAYREFGVWALVIQQVCNVAIDTMILWIIVPWHPKVMFSIKSFKNLFSYGWKLLVASLINTIYIDLRQLIIGRVYSPSDLAYYNQGNKFPQFISTNINSSIDSVLFPVLSDHQNNIDEIKSMTRRSIKISGYIMWPLLLGLAAISKNLVPIVLTDKWTPCIPYFIVGCFAYGLQPLQSANLNAIKAVGKSDIFLKLEIIKKTISTCIILISMPFGVLAIAIGSFIYSIIATICNSYPNRKLLHYTYFEQVKDLFPSFILAFGMGIFLFFLPLNFAPIWLRMVLQIIIGIIFYSFFSYILKYESFFYIKNILYDFITGKKKNKDKN